MYSVNKCVSLFQYDMPRRVPRGLESRYDNEPFYNSQLQLPRPSQYRSIRPPRDFPRDNPPQFRNVRPPKNSASFASKISLPFALGVFVTALVIAVMIGAFVSLFNGVYTIFGVTLCFFIQIMLIEARSSMAMLINLFNHTHHCVKFTMRNEKREMLFEIPPTAL